MAMIHEKLYQSDNLTDIRIDDYVERLVSDLFYSYNIPKDQIKLVLEVEEVELNMETAIPCGLIISEIVSNSLKHAFSHGRKGEVDVSLKLHNNWYELIIDDNGVGLPNDLNFKIQIPWGCSWLIVWLVRLMVRLSWTEVRVLSLKLYLRN